MIFRQRGLFTSMERLVLLSSVMNTLDELTYVAGTFFTLLLALAPFWVPAVFAMS